MSKLMSCEKSRSPQHDEVFDEEVGHRHHQNPEFRTLRRPRTVLTGNRWLIYIRRHHHALSLAPPSSPVAVDHIEGKDTTAVMHRS